MHLTFAHDSRETACCILTRRPILNVLLYWKLIYVALSSGTQSYPILSLYYSPASHSMWSLRRPQFRFSQSLSMTCFTCRASRYMYVYVYRRGDFRALDCYFRKKRSRVATSTWNHKRDCISHLLARIISTCSLELAYSYSSLSRNFAQFYFNFN